MAEDAAGRLDLAKLLVAVENAPPVAAAEVVGEWLEAALGAFDVSFLIVDFSGRALIRLGHAGLRAAVRTQGRETAEQVPLDGSAHGRALRDQAVDVELRAGEARLIAPVTNPGGGDRRARTHPPRTSGRADAGRRCPRGARPCIRHHRQPSVD